MELLDGWAIMVGNSACRFFSRNGHEVLGGLFCSDGSYAAGWRLIATSLGLVIMGIVFFKLLKPNP